MHHYFEAITNNKGDALTGYYVRLLDSGGSGATLYADTSLTPIVSVSGVADAAKVDANGNVNFYVAVGTYTLNIYATDSTTLVATILDVGMNVDADTAATAVAAQAAASSSATAAAASATSAAASYNSIASVTNATAHAATRTALALLGSSVGPVYLRESGREGMFVWSSSNNAANVTADTSQGIYVAPTSDTTGASGAWVRKSTVDTWFNIKWFGAVGDDVTDDYTAIQCALNVAKLTGGTVFFPAGNFRINTGLVLSLTVDGSLNIRIQGTPGSWLRTSAAIDVLTISNTNGGVANTRRAYVDCLAILVNNVSARGLVLVKASYNQFSNMEFLGTGTAIVVGTASDPNTIHNQFSNMRPQQVGKGIYLGGLYNIVTNFVCGEGITGAYAVQIDGNGNILDGFVVRGAGGTGGTATIEITSNSAASVVANGYVFDSYAIGVSVAGARHVKVTGVTIKNSQTHGLQLNGSLQGRFDVTLDASSLASADVSNHIHCTNTPTDNIITAQFVGTGALLDINEATGTRNVWICGTLPNGSTISGTDSVVIANGTTKPNNQTVTSAATVTPTFANDQVDITGQAVALALANPSGTAIADKRIVIRIKDNGTSQTISYGTQYRAMGVTLPVATTISKTVYLTCIYNNNATKLDVVLVSQEA